MRDVDLPAQTLTVSVTLDKPVTGAFTPASLTASGFVDAGGGVYNFSGTTTAATAAIRQLAFAPVQARLALGATDTTTFTISANDGIAAPVTNNITTVTVTFVGHLPQITGTVANQAIRSDLTATAFSTVTISDADLPPQTLKVSVKLDTAAKGAFTAASLAASGFTNATGGVYNFSGTATAATAAIRQLIFAPTAGRVAPGTSETTTFTIFADDGLAPVTRDSTTTVIASTPVPLTIASPASATPPNPGVGETVSFTVGVSGGTGTLTFTWDFGDGSPTASGQNATHAYPTAGTYTATVTITDQAGGSVKSTVTVVVAVTALIVGDGVDTDGDGVPDDVEIALGSSPTDPTSTPFGTGYLPLNVVKAQIKLNFTKTSADALGVSGTIHIPAGYSGNGQKVGLIVGGVVRAWTLNAKAMAKTADSSFKLQVKTKKKKVLEQDAKFTAAFKNVTLATTLASSLPNADAKKAAAVVTFNLVLNQTLYKKGQNMIYSAKKGKTGMAKSTKAK